MKNIQLLFGRWGALWLLIVGALLMSSWAPISVPAASQQQPPALKLGLIHSETAIYPDEIVLPLGVTVEIGHISLDGKTYPSVVLRVVNAAGQAAGALAFGTLPVSVEPNKITLQQFTADKPGEYEYTHILMGRADTKAKVTVR